MYLVEAAVEDSFEGVATEDAVGDERIDFGRALAFEQLRGARDGVGGIGEVVDEDARLAGDGADEEERAVGVGNGGVGVATFLFGKKCQLGLEAFGEES
jgi:hypothetical protein